MILFDTCSAMNCYKFSKIWIDSIAKKCNNKTILKTDDLIRELKGLSKKKSYLKDLINKLNKAPNVQEININTLTVIEKMSYLTYLSAINNQDSELILKEIPETGISLEELQTNGKKRLSSADKNMLAFSFVKNNTTLVTDDNRILKIVEKYHQNHSFICSPKVIEKIRNNTNFNVLLNICEKKRIIIYKHRYRKNKNSLC